jgi:hypothetical protein
MEIVDLFRVDEGPKERSGYGATVRLENTTLLLSKLDGEQHWWIDSAMQRSTLLFFVRNGFGERRLGHFIGKDQRVETIDQAPEDIEAALEERLASLTVES